MLSRNAPRQPDTVIATVMEAGDRGTAIAATVVTVVEAKVMATEVLVATAATADMAHKEAITAMALRTRSCHQLLQHPLPTQTARPTMRMPHKPGSHTTSNTPNKTLTPHMVVTKHILQCSSSNMPLTMVRPVMDRRSRLLLGLVPLHHLRLHLRLPSLHRLVTVLRRLLHPLLRRPPTTARYVCPVNTLWSKLTCH